MRWVLIEETAEESVGYLSHPMKNLGHASDIGKELLSSKLWQICQLQLGNLATCK